MAASFSKNVKSLQRILLSKSTSHRVVTRTAFFSRNKDKQKSGEELLDEVDLAILQKKTTSDALQYLKRKTSVDTVKGYSPPSDAESTIFNITQDLCGKQGDWKAVSLTDRRLKYKLLTRCMEVFDHSIPNTDLLDMNTVDDVVNFFNTKTKATTAYQDLGESELPKNVHLQMEPLRFDPKTDTFFGGVTAYPAVDTKVTSIKYKKKYKSVKAKQWKTG